MLIKILKMLCNILHYDKFVLFLLIGSFIININNSLLLYTNFNYEYRNCDYDIDNYIQYIFISTINSEHCFSCCKREPFLYQ